MPDPLPTWGTASVAAVRRFARVRLLALDVDGTLLEGGGHSVFGHIRTLANSTLLRPIHFVIATGRTLYGVAPILRQWPVTMNNPAILYNGSVVTTPRDNQVIYSRTISKPAVSAILDVCRIHHRPVLAYICRPQRILGSDSLEEVYGWTHSWRPETEFNGLSVNWQSNWRYVASTAPTAVLVKTPEQRDGALARDLRSLEGIEVTTSGGAFAEIRPHGSNKAAALDFVVSKLGLDRGCVLAMGDNDNDADMLRWAGIGVAVASASKHASANANYVCRHGVAGGVVEILRLIRSARRYYRDELGHTTPEVQ
ncbi:MAG: HAD-IIB family hydrolase [Gammaproteobacteria bacterium]|nr:HAD-IIB family hydrolase [Gammaproteobacteria bacterium]